MDFVWCYSSHCEFIGEDFPVWLNACHTTFCQLLFVDVWRFKRIDIFLLYLFLSGDECCCRFFQFWLYFSMVLWSQICQSIRYMILLNRADAMCTSIGKLVHLNNNKYIFERVGIMLHGRHSFYTKFSKIIKVRSVHTNW